MAKEKFELLITSAVMIGGAMVLPDKGKDSCVTLSHADAVNLLNRGKAEPLTEDNMPEPEGTESDDGEGDKAAAGDDKAGGDEATKAKATKAKPVKADSDKAGDDKNQPDKDEK